jgi:hypothetical protein
MTEAQMLASGLLLPRDHPLFAEMRQIVARDREMGLASSTDAALAEAMLRHYGEELDVLPSLFDLGAQNPMAQQIDKLKRLKQEQAQAMQGGSANRQQPPQASTSSSSSSSSLSKASSGSRLDVVLEDLIGELSRQQAKADSTPSSSSSSSSAAASSSTTMQGAAAGGDRSATDGPSALRPIYPPLKDRSPGAATAVVAGGQRASGQHHPQLYGGGQRWASDDVLGGRLDPTTPRPHQHHNQEQQQQEVILIGTSTLLSLLPLELCHHRHRPLDVSNFEACACVCR